MLSALATAAGRTARVALRVNPDVDAGTNDKITTGRATDKFGIPYDEALALYAQASSMPGIEPVGLAAHIGSQILDLAPYRDAFRRIADLVHALRRSGLRVETVDCGGGLGIPYRNEPAPSPAGLAAAMKGAFHNLDVRLAMEPGRWLVGPAGILLASVVLVKQTLPEPFVVLDAAMNDLVRPAMYDAWHGIVPVSPIDAVAPVRPMLGGRPGLRKQRHVREKPLASSVGTRRAGSDSRRRRVWCGDELNLQRAPAGSRGLGG